MVRCPPSHRPPSTDDWTPPPCKSMERTQTPDRRRSPELSRGSAPPNALRFSRVLRSTSETSLTSSTAFTAAGPNGRSRVAMVPMTPRSNTPGSGLRRSSRALPGQARPKGRRGGEPPPGARGHPPPRGRARRAATAIAPSASADGPETTTHKRKKEASRMGRLLLLGVAGAGFEPTTSGL